MHLMSQILPHLSQIHYNSSQSKALKLLFLFSHYKRSRLNVNAFYIEIQAYII